MFDAAHYTHPRKFSLAPIVRALLKQGVSRADIIAQTGITPKYYGDLARAAGGGRQYRSTVWTNEKEAKLIELTGNKLSASQIGAELGFTRNAVIGKWNRMGLSPLGPRATPRPKYKTPARKSRPTQRRRPDSALSPVQELFFTEAVDLPRDFSADLVSFMDAGPDQCRWPIGDPRTPAFRFCGTGVLDRHSYCPRHCRLAYTAKRGPRPFVPNYHRKISAFGGVV